MTTVSLDRFSSEIVKNNSSAKLVSSEFSMTRAQLYSIPYEERRKIVIEMALTHNEKEKKAGHIIDHKKTIDYKHHPLPEVDCLLFNYPCPEYYSKSYYNNETFDL